MALRIDTIAASPERVPPRRELAQAVAKRAVENPIPPRERFDRMYGHGMLQRLQGFHNDTSKAIEESRDALVGELEKSSPDAANEVTAICERLMTEPPREIGDPSDHPYIVASPLHFGNEQSDEPGKYEIDNAAVRSDIKTLQDIRKGFPSPALDTLIAHLQAFRLLDPKIQAFEKAEQMMGGKKSVMDTEGKEMGRVALTGILFAGAAIFGSISLVNYFKKGELSFAPLFWGIGAWMMADPSMWNSLFNKNEPIKQDFAEVGRVTNHPALRQLAITYGIGGSEWAKVVRNAYAGNHEDIQKKDHPTNEEIESAITGLTSDALAQKTLRAMAAHTAPGADKNDFMVFLNTLSNASRADAQECIANYVDHDALRYAASRRTV